MVAMLLVICICIVLTLMGWATFDSQEEQVPSRPPVSDPVSVRKAA